MGFVFLFSKPLCGGARPKWGIFRRRFLREESPPSPCERNSVLFLPMNPIYPLLCAFSCRDKEGSAVASTPSPALSPVISYGVTCWVCRDLIILVVVVVAMLKISTLFTSYHQLSHHNQKIGSVSCFACPI